MKTLEEIKNEFAIEISYNSWSEFKMINNRNIIKIEGAMDEVAKRYAREVAIASLEKASENISFETKKYNGRNFLLKNKNSITNEENIVLK